MSPPLIALRKRYQFMHIPFELINAPTTYKWLQTLNSTRIGERNDLCILNVLLFFSNNNEQHITNNEDFLFTHTANSVPLQLIKCN